MVSRNPTRLGLLLLLIVAFAHLLEGYDLTKRLEPKGKLQVRLDISLAREELKGAKPPEGRLRWQWSSYLTFWDDVRDVSDGQLKKMAIDAYKEMEADALQYKLQPESRENKRAKRTPGVMTILAWPHGILLASSQKGASGFITNENKNLVNSEVLRVLNLCESIFQESTITPQRPDGIRTDHINQRKCGEVYAYLLYEMIDKDNKLNDWDPPARITSVSREILEDGTWGDGYIIVPPCPGTNKHTLATNWGCNLVNKLFEVTYLNNEVEEEDYDLKELAGGLAGIGQQQLCGKLIAGKVKL
ncbi:hypothetical protein CEP51_008324 [Fusarium floridanum]|uniref:Uncharacterized protein n=1 Tax=Fusarium floridanum TaxID=1325733 RepID=A0A428RLB1_9HYPO|nr:hypothetical protein CEP51_008324 [Fusarium floridanum]